MVINHDHCSLINYANKDFPGFEVKELIEEGAKVVALGHWDAKSKKQTILIPQIGRRYFISEMENYTNTENTMTLTVRL